MSESTMDKGLQLLLAIKDDPTLAAFSQEHIDVMLGQGAIRPSLRIGRFQNEYELTGEGERRVLKWENEWLRYILHGVHNGAAIGFVMTDPPELFQFKRWVLEKTFVIFGTYEQLPSIHRPTGSASVIDTYFTDENGAQS